MEIPTTDELNYPYPCLTEDKEWLVHPHEEYLQAAFTPSVSGSNFSILYEIVVSCLHDGLPDFRRICQQEIYVHTMP